MLKYKKYLLTGGRPPRSTLHSRRKRAAQLQNQRDAQNSQIRSETEVCDIQPPVEARAPSSSSEMDEEVSTQEPKSKRRMVKRKVKPYDQAQQTFSSDSETSQSSHATVQSPPQCKSPQLHSVSSAEECFVLSDDENVCSKGIDGEQHSQTLCPCTEITVGDVLFMTLSLGLRHGLTWVAQVDILKLIGSIFKTSKIPATKAAYLKSLNVNNEGDIKHHTFCDDCHSYLGERRENSNVKTCGLCQKNISVVKASNTFVSLSIESQLMKFLKDENFVQLALNYRFTRPSFKEEINDIYDGQVYKNLCAEGGVLSSPYNFSYTFFTDGVPFGKSSNKTIWPIYLTLNELPYEKRSNYLILAGVYAGAKDPNQMYFLKPFVSEANKLSETGISWVHSGKDVISRLFPLCCVVDSVARYQILNFQSFHAVWGCTFCYAQSTKQRSGHRFTVSPELPSYRTQETLKQDLLEVYNRRHEELEKNRVCRGVKGACTLLSLNHFSITDCFVVDYMHAILVGVTKTHTELILESIRKKMWIGLHDERVGMGHLIATIDARIKSVQSNSAIIRELRPLKELSLWKASEFRSWLLFYCVPCLSGLLKDKYLLHLGMLSKATSILLQRSVSLEDVALAHKLYMMYIYFFMKHFGEDSMVYNVHLLSHICKVVQNFGPIWGHNSFIYESENRHILQLCKSPFSVAFQISRKFLVFQSLPTLCSEIVCCQAAISFSERILNYKRLVRYDKANDSNCILLGKAEYYCLNEDQKSKIIEVAQLSSISGCLRYQRILYRKKRFTTDQYCEGKENNDSCAILRTGLYVIIKEILRVLPANKVILLVQTIEVQRKPILENNYVTLDRVKLVEKFGDLIFINIDSMAMPCLLMLIAGSYYIAEIPYGCSVE